MNFHIFGFCNVQAEYDKAMSEKQALMDDADTCRRKMAAASALINGLGGEKERWTEQSKEYRAQIGRFVIQNFNCFIKLSDKLIHKRF